MADRFRALRVACGGEGGALAAMVLCLVVGCGDSGSQTEGSGGSAGSSGNAGNAGSLGSSGNAGSSGSSGAAGGDIFDAQSPVKVTWREPLPVGGRAERLVCPSADVCYAPSGHFLKKSSDGGLSWDAAGPFVGAFRAFECPSESICYGVVYDSQAERDHLVKTEDRGASFRLLETFNASALAPGLSCPDEFTCLLNRNSSSTITVGFRTLDGGQTFDDFRPPAGSNLNWHCFDAKECVGFGNGLWRTTDGGDSFKTESLSLFYCDREFCWEQDPAEFRVSTDRIRTVTPYPAPPLMVGDTYYGVACFSGGPCLAALGSGVDLYVSDDAGQSWQAATPPPAAPDSPKFATFADIREVVACPDAQRCFAGDPARHFYSSGDGGHTWAERFKPATGPEAVYAVDCPSPDACYVVGQVGKIVKSTDRGMSWTRLSISQTGDLRDVACADSSTCFVTGDSGQVLKTNDGGSTWTSMAQPSAATLGKLACPTADVCYVDAGAGQLMKTVDGGTSWTLAKSFAVDTRASYEFTDIKCFDPSTCVVLVRAQRGNITPSFSPERTLDGGVTWESASGAQFYSRFDSIDRGHDRMDCASPETCVGGSVVVSCPSPTSCVHYGDQSGSVTYFVTDAAATGGALPARDMHTVRTTLAGVSDLHCFDEKHCIGVGENVIVTIDVE